MRTLSLQRKRLVLAAVALAAVLVAVLVIVLGTRSSGASSSVDPELKRAGDRALTVLNRPGGKLPVTDGSLKSFQAWFYNEQTAFAKVAQQHQQRGVYVQVQYVDPNTMPPQVLGLNAPNHAFVAVDSAVASRVAQSGTPQYADGQAGTGVRIYVARIALPAPLQGSGVYGLVEVVGAP